MPPAVTLWAPDMILRALPACLQTGYPPLHTLRRRATEDAYKAAVAAAACVAAAEAADAAGGAGGLSLEGPGFKFSTDWGADAVAEVSAQRHTQLLQWSAWGYAGVARLKGPCSNCQQTRVPPPPLR